MKTGTAEQIFRDEINEAGDTERRMENFHDQPLINSRDYGTLFYVPISTVINGLAKNVLTFRIRQDNLFNLAVYQIEAAPSEMHTNMAKDQIQRLNESFFPGTEILGIINLIDTVVTTGICR